MPPILDIAGKRFGRLVVITRARVNGARNAMWLCQCDCGNTTVGAASNLGKTKFSCGCLSSENGTTTIKTNSLARTDLHGMSHTTEWRIWSQMRSRCESPDNHRYHRYGGRGIKVCERWQSFQNFYEDMGPRPSKRYSIDRIDNDGNYEKSNCRWATAKTQARNTSKTHWVTIEGTTLCVKDWCKALNVPIWKPSEMIRNRGAKRNLPPAYATIEDALTALYHGRT